METKTMVPIVISVVALLIAGAALSMGYRAVQAQQVPAALTINPSQVSITTSHGNLTLAQLAEIQPGLGTVMIEYGNRFYIMYYAAKSSNWDLASYQLKEAREIQEVGETTRPGRAPMLKSFESAYLDPLEKTITAKDWNAFQTAYNNTVQGCNGCHAANQFPYIKYTLPSIPPNLP
jgi:hypothetical protein